MFFFSLYFESKESKYQFHQNRTPYLENLKLISVKNYQTSITNYIIGCDKYQLNDKYHHYIKVNPITYDIFLLHNLFNKNAIIIKIIYNKIFKFKNNNFNNFYFFLIIEKIKTFKELYNNSFIKF